ncbi:hypothetical protein AYO21_09870 [Fonsecaea monophora]|uniref:Uncharacterized protein n=1 Tax=Fonsecaea monophora TaxID=254056 RepID=A0A177EV89_9EURO|nr:hypothetical protein AYO21_09870 [Fonsecaea monophora]KAH0848770.1 hypothetical protein FOPE_03240 [Fonsecaea pedrosoi]OAG35943.1 hypothetical protein AYO21_09870 [Fonsecaea monophora]
MFPRQSFAHTLGTSGQPNSLSGFVGPHAYQARSIFPSANEQGQQTDGGNEEEIDEEEEEEEEEEEDDDDDDGYDDNNDDYDGGAGPGPEEDKDEGAKESVWSGVLVERQRYY